MSPSPLALLIDMDGVLVDTETPALEALAETFADHGATIDAAEVMVRFRGKNLDRCPDEVSDVLGGSVPAGFIAEARRLARCGPTPQAERGALAVLSARIPRRIVTNSTLSWALSTLGGAGLQQAIAENDIVTIDRVDRPKPAPDLYLTAGAELGVAASDCLAIEDSITGLQAARAAGVPAVGYSPYPRHQRSLSAAGFPTITGLGALWGMTE